MTFPKRKLVYIAHRIAGDPVANLASARQWTRWAILDRNVAPIVPYLGLMDTLNEHDEKERELGVEIGFQMIDLAEELWVCGPTPPPESFVWKEFDRAIELGIPVINFTSLGLPLEYKR